MQTEATLAQADVSDLDLVTRCQAGDTEAFDELVTRYRTRVFGMIYNMVHSEQDAWDLAQDSFLKAWKSIKRFRGRSTFYTWIYRIAVNLAIDAQRRQKRNPLDFRETMDGVLEAQEETARDPFADVHDRELRENLIRAINELTPEHKAVIVLRTIEGLSYKDIGDILGCSEGTVMSRLHYARKKLQDKLSAFL